MQVSNAAVALVPDAGMNGYQTGDRLLFDTALQPESGDIVLIRAKSGELMVRGYALGSSPDRWLAKATAPGYPDECSSERGLTVLGVAVSRWPLPGLNFDGPAAATTD